ncbi:MAG: hypothetical protein HFJ06_00585 [Lachnospiraceae bacterium]|nr:hypothetical protein [Lachnospiraceae bacterium]
MTKEDMIIMVEAADSLREMDLELVRLTGKGYSTGEFVRLDNIYKVIKHNIHSSYKELTEEEIDKVLMEILNNEDLSVEERANLLLKGKKN